MDNHISLQVKKLIELDKKADELQKKRAKELKELEQNFRNEAERINGIIAVAKEEAKDAYNKLVEEARQEAQEVKVEIDQRLSGIESKMNQHVESVTAAWWNKIMEELK